VIFCVFAYKMFVFSYFAPSLEVGQNFAPPPLENTEMTSLGIMGRKHTPC